MHAIFLYLFTGRVGYSELPAIKKMFYKRFSRVYQQMFYFKRQKRTSSCTPNLPFFLRKCSSVFAHLLKKLIGMHRCRISISDTKRHSVAFFFNRLRMFDVLYISKSYIVFITIVTLTIIIMYIEYIFNCNVI